MALTGLIVMGEKAKVQELCCDNGEFWRKTEQRCGAAKGLTEEEEDPL